MQLNIVWFFSSLTIAHHYEQRTASDKVFSSRNYMICYYLKENSDDFLCQWIVI